MNARKDTSISMDPQAVAQILRDMPQRDSQLLAHARLAILRDQVTAKIGTHDDGSGFS